MGKFEWKGIEDRCRNSKILCIHGIKITDFIQLELLNENLGINIMLVPYDDFVKEYNEVDLINTEDLAACDTVTIVSDCCNNTIEVQAIKTVISVLYFTKRMCASEKCYKDCYNSYKEWYKDDNICKKIMLSNVTMYHDFFHNYTLDGYYAGSTIENASWYVNIGRYPLENDDFERWATRIYGGNLTDSYSRRDGMERRSKIIIEIDDNYKKYLHKIMEKVNGTDQYAKKLGTVMRLYYEVLCDFKNPDYTVILYCTIFETLLLSKDDNQRKKVSARAACITANDLELKYKKFIANQVYNFYRYRNAIIHDGLGLMDFSDEIGFNNSIVRMKSVIFTIVKYIVKNDIKTVDEILDITRANASKDGLKQAFDYISMEEFNNNPSYFPPLFCD